MNLPTTPQGWEALYAAADDELRAEIDHLFEQDLAEHIWRAQVGRQSEAADSTAFVTGYGGSAGGGKALAIDTPIPTPDGWTTMATIAPGDRVLGADGKPCVVLAATPVMIGRPCYRVTFSDGEEIVADADHLWHTMTDAERVAANRMTPEARAARRAKRARRGKGVRPDLALRNRLTAQGGEPPTGEIRSTREIAETLFARPGRLNHSVKLAEAIELPDADLPIEPYLLGAWLGDGTSRGARITIAEHEMIEHVIASAAAHDWSVTDGAGKYDYGIVGGLKVALRESNLLQAKHVPQAYLRASREQRIAMLQGLMDTDGYADLRGQCEFTTCSIDLANGVQELIVSLGCKAAISVGMATIKGREIAPKYRIKFLAPFPAFRLSRKVARQKLDNFRPTTTRRYITAVEPVESVPVRCIQVDSEDRLYLAGRNMVPTHNSDLLCGIALTEHKRSAIFRRERVQTEGIIQRMTEILGTTDGLNSQKGIWKTHTDGSDRLIEFGGLDNPDDHQKWQGRAHDLKGYDEVTEQREHQVRFTMGWTRSPDPKQHCRVLMTFNPPTTAEGRWVIDYFGPWLDKKHPDPAEPGEVRWVTTIKGRDVWVPDNRKFVLFRGEPLYDFDPSEFSPEKIITPKSRTFIPSRVTDNYFYVRSGYIETLQSLPEPLRSQMLEGDFSAGVEDDEWQVIPTAWVEAAMDRWEPREQKGEMDSMGVDVAVGGRDEFLISRRHSAWFDELIAIPGHEIPQDTAGQVGAAHVIRHRRDRAPVHVDMIGWGLTVHNALVDNEIQCIGVNVARGTKEKTAEGTMGFLNVRAELVWRMRETLDPAHPVKLALPPDPQLKADLCAYKWKPSKAGIQIKSKDEMKVELGRSPDKGDAVLLANIDTIKDEVVQAMTVRKAYDPYAELNA